MEKTNKQSRFDERFMRFAEDVAEESSATKLKVGAVITRDNRPIGSGYNGTPKGLDNKCEDADGNTYDEVVHAEMNAICFLARTNESTEGTTLYTTSAPCLKCAALLIQCGIKRVVYKRRYRYDYGINLLREAGVIVETLDPQQR